MVSTSTLESTAGEGSEGTGDEMRARFVVPASFAQRRLWFIDQFEPDSPAYNIPQAFRVKGRLDVAALERSLNEVVRRHEVLRTTFEAVDGRPVQVIAPHLTVPFRVKSLCSLPEARREAQALEMISQEAQLPLDLSTGPLIRTSLFQLGEERHILGITLHHIVSDAWSSGVLLRELSALYGAFSDGRPSPLPELPIQYADFSVWQEEWLKGKRLQRQLAYWKGQLDGLPVLETPTDFPRPPVQSHRGSTRTTVLPDALSCGLKELSDRQGTTLFMTMLAAYNVLLSRLAGQDDVVVGSAISGRPRLEVEPLIGLFINMLVFRNDLSGNPSFQVFLARVRRTCLEAYAHRDVPFERLVEELQPERDLSRSPLFQVMINMQNAAAPEPEWADLSVDRITVDSLGSRYDMVLTVAEKPDHLELRLTYSTGLYSGERMACLLEQFRALLDQILASPGTPVRSYSLVTPESRDLLPDPSAALEEPAYEPVTVQFDRCAQATPTQPAVVQGDRQWTYGELASSARELAKTLRAGGLEEGETVAVLGRRSYGLVAGVMSVLLGGGVLLLVDPDLPARRRQMMIEQASARILLRVRDGDQNHEPRDGTAHDVLDVDQSTGQLRSAEALPRADSTALPTIDPDDPAYVFFTSGTTGVPRGVVGSHKGLSHFIDWAREAHAISPQDRCPQLMSPGFEPIMRDLFLPLTSGATLCLPEDADMREPGGFWRWLERDRLTVLHSVPSMAQVWLDNVPDDISPPNVRELTLGGEPLTDTTVRRWRAVLGDSTEIVNLYGPTETTLAKCYYRVPEDIPYGVQPVGSPMPQTQALVLTPDGRLCGIGEPGEIVLRTPFRAMGYLDDPDGNEACFVRNPFTGDDGDLLYHTGDRGRYRPDGLLEILGRLDDQVKIRGKRVEPDEVTAVLAGHPGVRSCRVVPGKDRQGETNLIAYVVAGGHESVTERQIRSYLAQYLPVTMIPAAVVFLDSIPLTSSGKIDRRALPTPELAEVQPLPSPAGAHTPVQERLLTIWSEVLRTTPTGVHDDFFDLGGHSLLAVQVVARIRDALGVDLPLRTVFEAPTIAELAQEVEKAPHTRSGTAAAPELAPLERTRRRSNHTDKTDAAAE